MIFWCAYRRTKHFFHQHLVYISQIKIIGYVNFRSCTLKQKIRRTFLNNFVNCKQKPATMFLTNSQSAPLLLNHEPITIRNFCWTIVQLAEQWRPMSYTYEKRKINFFYIFIVVQIHFLCGKMGKISVQRGWNSSGIGVETAFRVALHVRLFRNQFLGKFIAHTGVLQVPPRDFA